ncbi:MAG: hypothetical protein EB167_08270, partial [Nitrososphaeria archaeon]|nr:hypothetical protein [Nitrososphaeria archaeon]
MKDDNISDFLPLTNLTAQDFDKTIAKLDEFWKAKSIAILDKLGFHVLPGAAILAWNEKISLKLLNYCKENNWTSVTIRTDKAKETGENIPRGGYQVQINKLETEIKKHLRNGRIVIVHEPRDRYKNLYGINVLYDNKIPTELYFEVVGHGFEVSNLNRGDIQPHEKLVIRKKNDEFVILKRDIISNSEYKNSVNLRYQQIGISLMDQTVESSMSKK